MTETFLLRRLTRLSLCLFLASAALHAAVAAQRAPVSPWQMQRRMGLGINLGNTLDAPTEGAWAPRAKASFFDEYKAKGSLMCGFQYSGATTSLPRLRIGSTLSLWTVLSRSLAGA